MDLGQFARRMAAISTRIEPNTASLMKKVALAVDQAVVIGTPVDKGRARSNWVVSIGVPYDKVNSPYAPGSKLGIGETANLAGALTQGKGAVAAYKLKQGPIWIVNNVHYIGLLNAGTSKQAPEGFIETAVAAGVAVVPQARIIT